MPANTMYHSASCQRGNANGPGVEEESKRAV